MISSPPCHTVPGHVTLRLDGSADVVPYFLPLNVAKEAMTMTVQEYLRLTSDEEARREHPSP